LPRLVALFAPLFALVLLLASRPAGAHEFWLQPDRYQLDAGGTVSLSLFVGEKFRGELTGIGAPALVRAEHYTAQAKHDLSPMLGRVLAGALPLRLQGPGTHLVAMDTNPSTIELPAGKFNDYLAQEGLDAVIEARATAGRSASPGRERYRRNIKTLVVAGGVSDAAFSRRTGQRLEIVALTDPFALPAAGPGTMAFQVFFDDLPLRGALVKLWHRGGPTLLTLQGRTDTEGRFEATLPLPGEWMASVVHMIVARGAPDADWDSYWGNLTFETGGLSARR